MVLIPVGSPIEMFCCLVLNHLLLGEIFESLRSQVSFAAGRDGPEWQVRFIMSFILCKLTEFEDLLEIVGSALFVFCCCWKVAELSIMDSFCFGKTIHIYIYISRFK